MVNSTTLMLPSGFYITLPASFIISGDTVTATEDYNAAENGKYDTVGAAWEWKCGSAYPAAPSDPGMAQLTQLMSIQTWWLAETALCVYESCGNYGGICCVSHLYIPAVIQVRTLSCNPSGSSLATTTRVPPPPIWELATHPPYMGVGHPPTSPLTLSTHTNARTLLCGREFCLLIAMAALIASAYVVLCRLTFTMANITNPQCFRELVVLRAVIMNSLCHKCISAVQQCAGCLYGHDCFDDSCCCMIRVVDYRRETQPSLLRLSTL